MATTAGWINLNKRRPPEHCGFILVTNNLKARDAFGHHSHVWLTYMVHENKDGRFEAFAEPACHLIQNVTHWRQAILGEAQKR